jgi:hypothetical protein
LIVNANSAAPERLGALARFSDTTEGSIATPSSEGDAGKICGAENRPEGIRLSKTDPIFWFIIQIAMLAGFLTSYPVNWWLPRAGIKEKM